MILTEKDFMPLFTRVTDLNGKTTVDIELRFARNNSKERKLAEVLKESIQEIIDDIEEIKNGIVNLNGKYFIFSENKQKRTVLVQIKFDHKLNGETVKFNIDEESDGTQRLLDLLPILFAMDKKSSVIYFVDEIDRSLHTKLSQYLLSKFIFKCQTTLNQIVFTAHDVNLLNMNKFSQDEIWFIEKNNLGESKLKPLSDFNVQVGQDTLKAYLNGRFGAVPVIRGDM